MKGEFLFPEGNFVPDVTWAPSPDAGIVLLITGDVLVIEDVSQKSAKKRESRDESNYKCCL